MTVTDIGSRIIKVDHAGEFGAISIYTGQIVMAKLFARDLVPELIEFRSHERGHRAIFAAELNRRGRPRCKSYWLCGSGGLVLGLVTGLLGRSAISATTVAVESVVLRHLEQQLIDLRGIDEAAVLAISAIVMEERLHHDQAASHVAQSSLWSRLLNPVVSSATEAVIWLGMRA
ncbi:ubiquinone biosynthesis monooxygenase Coq7 [Luteibacter sp. OK325]|jgi:ubiquinone biosynthesis monooxygenase Coq7|uniref:demethoxyubiquinone hydroxylase family protein n=1 Tax=Luteibacter sp. OK325 TaxID=2135670 RepID=UPI000D34EAE8|nr:demethoxyubiquinone hydroxylase family protein [Luteibacter sp. OK325]PTR34382.1 ubiquinone biosynthesis monooxygenase Coq7 [Luteibacter sp. OK325]